MFKVDRHQLKSPIDFTRQVDLELVYGQGGNLIFVKLRFEQRGTIVRQLETSIIMQKVAGRS